MSAVRGIEDVCEYTDDRRRCVVSASGIGLIAVASLVAGCGGGGDSTATTADEPSKALRAAALSLQEAMDTSSRAIDGVRATRASLERVGSTLEPHIAQTGDVIGLLTPRATDAGPDRTLLTGAREQRTFLQYAADSTSARTRRAATGALTRANAAGRRAITAFSAVAQEASYLGGVLPASTTFNTGRLRDAVERVTRGPKSRTPTKSGGTPPPATGGTAAEGSRSCGGGLTVNSVTSCSFAENVRDEYRRSGGAPTIEVFSPTTQRLYTMSCSGGLPTVCRGGNGAAVFIR